MNPYLSVSYTRTKLPQKRVCIYVKCVLINGRTVEGAYIIKENE